MREEAVARCICSQLTLLSYRYAIVWKIHQISLNARTECHVSTWIHPPEGAMMVPEWSHAEELCHCDDRRCRSRSIGKTESIRRPVDSVRVNDGSADPNERLRRVVRGSHLLHRTLCGTSTSLIVGIARGTSTG